MIRLRGARDDEIRRNEERVQRCISTDESDQGQVSAIGERENGTSCYEWKVLRMMERLPTVRIRFRGRE
jgi:hypothetical protein